MGAPENWSQSETFLFVGGGNAAYQQFLDGLTARGFSADSGDGPGIELTLDQSRVLRGQLLGRPALIGLGTPKAGVGGRVSVVLWLGINTRWHASQSRKSRVISAFRATCREILGCPPDPADGPIVQPGQSMPAAPGSTADSHAADPIGELPESEADAGMDDGSDPITVLGGQYTKTVSGILRQMAQ